MTRCAKCKQYKPFKDFYKRVDGRVRSECKLCYRERNRLYRLTHPSKKVYDREKAMKYYHEVYKPRLKAKNCIQCGCVLKGYEGSKTGYCYSCDPTAITEALSYLERDNYVEYSAFGR